MKCLFRIGLIGLMMMPSLKASDGVKKFEKQKFFREDAPVNMAVMQDTTVFSQKFSYQKSKKKSFFYSLLLPGLGELYQNDWKFTGWGSGLYYFTVEALLWSGHFYCNSYSGWVREDSRSLAARSAGVDIEAAKPGKYYVNIGKFSDIYRYNELQRRLVGTTTLYEETEGNFWQWDNDKHRRKYDRLRTKSDVFKSYSQYVLWGVFTNHVLSAVNSMRLFRSHQPANDAELHFNMMPGSYKANSYEVTVGFLVKF